MDTQEKLYETLGELLYTVAIADGVIQSEERNTLLTIFRNHPFKNEIQWSFNYEESKNSSLEESYRKAVNFCHRYGPSPTYLDFIEAMELIAKAANGITTDESSIIASFSKDLVKRFQRDTEVLVSYHRPERD